MNSQMNSAVRKIHNLLSSGAVTVTGPNQPRILKQKVGSTTVTPSNNSLQQVNNTNRCYVCDDALGPTHAQHPLTDMLTSHTSTKFPNKIGQLVGDAFMVIVSVEDVVCSRCTNLLNYLDRLENDVERVRTNLMNLLHKKYGLNDEGGGGGGASANSPPIKMQKLNSGISAARATDDSNDLIRTRKVLHATASDSPMGKQSPPVSAVQQIKISTQPVAQQNSAGTQTLQRKTTKIYKCLSCDYKTSDMRLFNNHYETCKQQNFQCKNCKKIFPNFGTMKQHMVREHNTVMDNTCAVCHINFANEAALRKHMEMNHSTSVVVTSTTTLPASSVAIPSVDSITSGGVGGATSTPLYTCNHCQFKSTDKVIFDEHLRKHLSGVAKPKPFKCRLCAQRFETREAATVHAKQHQPNYFKCGTCAMSFPKRELLVKHFEVHQQQTIVAANPTHQQQQPQQQHTTSVSNVVVKQAQPQQQQHQQSQNLLTTQKLLQDTIDEALSDSGVSTSHATVGVSAGSGAADGTSAAANNIRFFSCAICSLTFIQETYYNQHMETHRREKKGMSNNGTSIHSTASSVTPTLSNSGVSSSSSLTPVNSNAVALHGGDVSSHHSSLTLPTQKKGGRGSISDASSNAIAKQSNAAAGNISEADIESIFEKMHSDKSDSGAGNSDNIASSGSNTATTNTTSASGAGRDNLVITSQESSGGITFNITIPQPEADGDTKSSSNAAAAVSIDMPMLDQTDEHNSGGGKSNEKLSEGGTTTRTATSAPVSMPSLDDDNDSHEHQMTTDASSAKSQQSRNNNSINTGSSKKSDTAIAANDSEKADSSDARTREEEQHEHERNTETESGAGGGVEVSNEHSGGEGESAAATTGEDQEHDQQQQDHEHEDEHEHQQVSMDLDEAMQAQVDSGQIKFILNENGQLLQLDNHIITDADGNQILVQDPEQIQQLLQSVGVLQSGDGLDGETLQMMTDANGQMVLVQGGGGGEHNETQLIDASLLNADGQLVIQQGQDGDLGEGAHVIGEDGTRIPVSVSYTADGQPIVQVQQQHMESATDEDASQHHHQQQHQEKDNVDIGDGGESADGASQSGHDAEGADVTTEGSGGNTDQHDGNDAAGGDGGGGSGGFFALEELMQHSSEAKAAE